MNKALIILCGGKSTRMGTDKALLPFGNCSLIEYMVEKFRPSFPKIYLSVRQKGDYAHLNLPVTEIQDLYMNAGPLGGIFSSLSMIEEERAFVLSIDTPFIEMKLADMMMKKSVGYQLCALGTHHYCGVYSKDCITNIGKNILLKQLSPKTLHQKCNTISITEKDVNAVCKQPLSSQMFSLYNRISYYEALKMLHNFHPEYFIEKSELAVEESIAEKKTAFHLVFGLIQKTH